MAPLTSSATKTTTKTKFFFFFFSSSYALSSLFTKPPSPDLDVENVTKEDLVFFLFIREKNLKLTTMATLEAVVE
jgi:hypothetical protein